MHTKFSIVAIPLKFAKRVPEYSDNIFDLLPSQAYCLKVKEMDDEEFEAAVSPFVTHAPTHRECLPDFLHTNKLVGFCFRCFYIWPLEDGSANTFHFVHNDMVEATCYSRHACRCTLFEMILLATFNTCVLIGALLHTVLLYSTSRADSIYLPFLLCLSLHLELRGCLFVC